MTTSVELPHRLQPHKGERSDESKRAYFANYAEKIQTEVAYALDEALLQDYGNENPLIVMAHKLLEAQDIDTSVLDIHPDRMADVDVALMGCFKAVKETVAQSTTSLSDSPAPSTESQGPEWSLTGWLTALELDTLVADALRIPLMEEFDASKGDKNTEAELLLTRSFINTLGELSSHEPILRLLQKENLLEHLAERLWHGAKRASDTDGDGGQGDGKFGAASKFFEDGEKALQFGDLSTFYEGLDHFLGPPNPNLEEAMQNEHCKARDSDMDFRVPNCERLRAPPRHATAPWFLLCPDSPLRRVCASRVRVCRCRRHAHHTEARVLFRGRSERGPAEGARPEPLASRGAPLQGRRPRVQGVLGFVGWRCGECAGQRSFRDPREPT